MGEGGGPEGARIAPLSAAFPRRQVGTHPAYVKFLVSARAPEGLAAVPEYALTDRARMERGVVRRDPPGGAGPEGHEDAACHRRLRRLGAAGRAYEYGPGSTLAGLAGLVAGLNEARPRRLRLDRAVINTGMRDALFGGPHGARGPYVNVAAAGGTKFLHHRAIPGDTAYVMSSRQAPLFVFGPGATERSGGAEVTTRESGFVEPPDGLPECPWGYRLDVRRANGARAAAPAG